MKLKAMVLCLSLWGLAGCDKGATAPVQAATAATPATDTDSAAFLAGFDGVWATMTSAGTDDAETVFRFKFGKAHSDFVMDAHVFDVHLVDVDTDNQVVTFETSGERDPKELLTVTRIVDAKDRGNPDAPFTLRVTFGNGQFSDLSFVRRLAPQDLDAINRARDAMATPVLAVPDAPTDDPTDPCTGGNSFVERMTCTNPAVKAAQKAFDMAFVNAETEYGTEVHGSQAAARKQLEACASTECLQKTYADWTRYVAENYPDRSPHAE